MRASGRKSTRQCTGEYSSRSCLPWDTWKGAAPVEVGTSWRYWLRYLAALGETRGRELLAVSQVTPLKKRIGEMQATH